MLIPGLDLQVQQVLNQDEENELTSLIRELHKLGVKVRAADVRKIVYSFAKRRIVDANTTNWVNEMASVGWFRSFLTRRPKVRRSLTRTQTQKVEKIALGSPQGKICGESCIFVSILPF